MWLCGLSMTKREEKGGVALMMSRRLHAPSLFFFAACQNQISLSLLLSFLIFSPQSASVFLSPHLCLIYPSESENLSLIPLFFPFITVSFSLPFCYLQIFHVSSWLRGVTDRQESCIDIQMILLQEIRKAIVSYP